MLDGVVGVVVLVRQLAVRELEARERERERGAGNKSSSAPSPSPSEKQAQQHKWKRNGGGGGPKLLLVSTRAGNMGLNMVGANHCVVFDASWNPAQDRQAMFRVYRYGQTRPVSVYRLVAKGRGLLESKVYKRQVSKMGESAAPPLSSC